MLVTLTPTYTGCPATAVIAADVEAALQAAGVDRVQVRTVLAPAWTTDWISQTGGANCASTASPRRARAGRLPRARAGRPDALRAVPALRVRRTREVSRFGSTPCKSHWTCRACLEPFDSFKAI